MGIGNRPHLFLDVFILLFISEIHMYVFHGELNIFSFRLNYIFRLIKLALS